jgi:lysyl-tRNA synthetase, class II
MFVRFKALGRRVPPPTSGRTALVWAAAGAWLLAGLDELTLHAAGNVVIGCVMATSLLVARASARRPLVVGSRSPEALGRARAVVDAHGEDSLSPFILRPDKSFAFGGGGVVAYRVIGRTAVVSGDPVGPDASVAALVGPLMRRAHLAGGRVVLYGTSERHLSTYRALGLRAVCVGEEAVVDPAAFSLEGRAVRKLRQSVNRVARRGWRIEAYRGREIDARLEAEIDSLEDDWRLRHERMLGFAMAMGEFDLGVRPADLYVLAWSPEGKLGAVMRFLSYRGNLSLDTMRRVGDTPNGLNESLVCRALLVAREHGVGEVSLNYAGLGHLVRRGPSNRRLVGVAQRVGLAWLGRHFQMDRLVLFNEKFSPQWRPRYLVYESRRALLASGLRVLQAEGYLPDGRRKTMDGSWQARHPASLASPAPWVDSRTSR